MWTIYSDVRLSRRQRLCHVVDDKGELRWSGGRIADALNFVVEEGRTTARLDGDEYSFELQIARLPQ